MASRDIFHRQRANEEGKNTTITWTGPGQQYRHKERHARRCRPGYFGLGAALRGCQSAWFISRRLIFGCSLQPEGTAGTGHTLQRRSVTQCNDASAVVQQLNTAGAFWKRLEYMDPRERYWKSRPREVQNILWKLRKRELFQSKPGTRVLAARRFALNIYPNCTLLNVHRPSISPRKFSPNGKLFIGTSDDLTTLVVYDYRGAAAADSLLRSGDNKVIAAQAFSCFFRLKWGNHADLSRPVQRVQLVHRGQSIPDRRLVRRRDRDTSPTRGQPSQWELRPAAAEMHHPRGGSPDWRGVWTKRVPPWPNQLPA